MHNVAIDVNRRENRRKNSNAGYRGRDGWVRPGDTLGPSQLNPHVGHNLAWAVWPSSGSDGDEE
jgi:hypothetical protein